MTVSNEDSKNLNNLPDKLSLTECNNKSKLFREIILGLIAFSSCSYLFFELPSTLDISSPIFIPLSAVIYILHNCFLGLAIGCAIAYGVKKNKWSNKEVLFTFILLCSFLAYLKYTPNFLCGLPKYLSDRPILLLYFCLVCFGIVGFISYEKTRYLNFYFILIPLCSFLVYIVLYYFNREHFQLHFYNDEIGIQLAYLHILYIFFLSLGIKEIISYKIEKNRKLNKKRLFIFTLLCCFLAYIIFSFISYIIAPIEIASFGYFGFLQINLVRIVPGSIFCYHRLQGFYEPTMRDLLGKRMWEYVINFYSTITFGKLDSYYLTLLINIQIWFAEFLITVLCAWRYIIFACPYFSSANKNTGKKEEEVILNE